jgi:hypothetical protein
MWEESMKKLTIIIRHQLNGLYQLEAYDNGVVVKEEKNFPSQEAAAKRADELREENDAAQQGTGSE